MHKSELCRTPAQESLYMSEAVALHIVQTEETSGSRYQDISPQCIACILTLCTDPESNTILLKLRTNVVIRTLELQLMSDTNSCN